MDKFVNSVDEHIDPEDDHINAEDDHINAEDEHINAEDEHIHAEDRDINAEDETNDAEDEHINAEDGHINAEDENQCADNDQLVTAIVQKSSSRENTEINISLERQQSSSWYQPAQVIESSWAIPTMFSNTASSALRKASSENEVPTTSSPIITAEVGTLPGSPMPSPRSLLNISNTLNVRPVASPRRSLPKSGGNQKGDEVPFNMLIALLVLTQ